MMADLFAMMDRDHGGEIEIDELESTLEFLGLRIQPEALAAVIEALDVDGGGTVDREEFFTRVRHILRQRRKAYGGDRALGPSGGRRGRPGSADGVFRFRSLVPDPRSTYSLQDLGTLQKSSYDVHLSAQLPPYKRVAVG
jgi:hypothetical protein